MEAKSFSHLTRALPSFWFYQSTSRLLASSRLRRRGKAREEAVSTAPSCFPNSRPLASSCAFLLLRGSRCGECNLSFSSTLPICHRPLRPAGERRVAPAARRTCRHPRMSRAHGAPSCRPWEPHRRGPPPSRAPFLPQGKTRQPRGGDVVAVVTCWVPARTPARGDTLEMTPVWRRRCMCMERRLWEPNNVKLQAHEPHSDRHARRR